MTRPCVLALGFFDGVHIGHGGLLRRTRETADRLGVPAAALTFDTHPDTLVSGHSVPLLNTPEDRAALMRKYYGIDEVLTLHFDRETMTQPWERFAEETLLRRYHARAPRLRPRFSLRRPRRRQSGEARSLLRAARHRL